MQRNMNTVLRAFPAMKKVNFGVYSKVYQNQGIRVTDFNSRGFRNISSQSLEDLKTDNSKSSSEPVNLTEFPHFSDKNTDALSYMRGYSDGNEILKQTLGKFNPSMPSANGKIKFSSNLWDKLSKATTILVLGSFVYLFFTLKSSMAKQEIEPLTTDITFDDVQGCDEAKEELMEVVDFLKTPEKYSRLGGKLPKGYLLVGPPGTGKTLLARAIAGQARVPFFQASGSEFEEVLVGQGARRLRDLFKVAKTKAPCLIFIDEIDSVGSKRSTSELHPYANQTINQLLAEMDGFIPNEGVIVIGATNRPDDLDKALLRSGRFDFQVAVNLPDKLGRKQILSLYVDQIKNDGSIDLEQLARMTVNFSGADLENMVNTAAIKAASDNKPFVSMQEFEFAHDRKVLGNDWSQRVRNEKDLLVTAVHEAGHTLVNYYTDNTPPLHKVTIVSKGATGGHTAFLPENDEALRSKIEMKATLDVAMGGRAAEELVFGKEEITDGASSDLLTASYLAETMVKRLGMSEKFGLRVLPEDKGPFDKNCISNELQQLADSEVQELLNISHKRALDILGSHRAELDRLTEALLAHETLDALEVETIINAEVEVSRLLGGGKKLGKGNHSACTQIEKTYNYCTQQENNDK